MAQSQFPESIHAAARALMVIQRESSRNAEQALRTMFPGERTPDHSTLLLWRSQFDEISHEESALIAQNNRRIALLASDSVIEDLEHRPHDSSALQKMTIAGIAQSKEHERLQRNHDKANPRTDQRLVFVFNGEPTVTMISEPSDPQ